MNSIKINEFSEYTQKEIMGFFLLKGFSKSLNRSGNKWRTAEIEDITGKGTIIIWEENFREEFLTLVNKVVKMIGQVTMKNGQLQLTVSSMELAKEEEYQLEDFTYSISEEMVEAYGQVISSSISMVNNPSIKKVLETIFTKKMVSGICQYPCSLNYIHPYNGGLMGHIAEVTDMAIALHGAESLFGNGKPYRKKVNLDYIIAGALLHDIGLIYCYVPYPFASKTQKGELLGHVSMSLNLFHKAYAKVEEKGFTLSENDIMQIEHIIVATSSGHNPMTKEAVIVCKANTTSKVLSSFDVVLGNSEELGSTVYNGYVKHNILKEVDE